jgi:hypothetical protein
MRFATQPHAPNCHLFRPPIELTDIKWEEDLFESSHYDVWLGRCGDCGQQYVVCYIEVFDDSWSFYAQITDADLPALRENYDSARALIEGRPHIVWPPRIDGTRKAPYWGEGRETALTMGWRPW